MRARSARQVVDAERDPVVVPKVELGGVPDQMRLGDVEIAAIDPTLKDREVILGGVGVPEIGADVFLGAVVHRAVPRESRPIDQ